MYSILLQLYLDIFFLSVMKVLLLYQNIVYSAILKSLRKLEVASEAHFEHEENIAVAMSSLDLYLH